MRVAATAVYLPNILASFFILLLQSNAVQSAPVVVTDCVKDETATAFNCEIRLKSPAEIDSVFLKSGASSPEKVLDFRSFGQEGQEAAWLLLVDQSNPNRAKIIDKITLQIRSHILKNRRADQYLGIAGYAESLNILAPVGSNTEELHRALDKLQSLSQNAYLFKNSLEAIRKLSAVKADRKALVLFSDGTNSDQSAKVEDVVSAAKAAGILIYGIGFTDKNSGSTHLQNLWQLAEQTGGLFRSVDPQTQALSDHFSKLFFGHLESGGQLSFPIPADAGGETDLQLIVQFKDGSRALAEIAINAEPQAIHNAIVKLIGDMEMPSPLYIAAIVLTLIFLISMVLRFAVRRKSQDTVPRSETRVPRQNKLRKTRKLDDPPMQLVGANDSNFEAYDAWFEIIDQDNTRFPVNQPMMQIGRHADNDIRLQNATVHRRHAVLQETPDGRFLITNLSGENGNGVLVNDQLVERRELKNGDVVELGEVRVRFRSRAKLSAEFPGEFESERLSGTG